MHQNRSNCTMSLKSLWNPSGSDKLYLQDTNKQEDDDSQNQQVDTQPLREDWMALRCWDCRRRRLSRRDDGMLARNSLGKKKKFKLGMMTTSKITVVITRAAFQAKATWNPEENEEHFYFLFVKKHFKLSSHCIHTKLYFLQICLSGVWITEALLYPQVSWLC